jgi:hypothetical protein
VGGVVSCLPLHGYNNNNHLVSFKDYRALGFAVSSM